MRFSVGTCGIISTGHSHAINPLPIEETDETISVHLYDKAGRIRARYTTYLANLMTFLIQISRYMLGPLFSGHLWTACHAEILLLMREGNRTKTVKSRGSCSKS